MVSFYSFYYGHFFIIILAILIILNFINLNVRESFIFDNIILLVISKRLHLNRLFRIRLITINYGLAMIIMMTKIRISMTSLSAFVLGFMSSLCIPMVIGISCANVFGNSHLDNGALAFTADVGFMSRSLKRNTASIMSPIMWWVLRVSFNHVMYAIFVLSHRPFISGT